MNMNGIALPWLLPGVAVSLVLSVVMSRAAGQALSVHRLVAWVLLLSFG